MTKSLPRLMGATTALALLCCFWIPASAHAASPPGATSYSGTSASEKTTIGSTRHGARPSRAARVKRAARAPAFSPPGSPPPALVGAAPVPWNDVFAQAGAWASDPIIVSGRILGDTLANAGLTRVVDNPVTGPRAGLTGLYQTVWHRALSSPVSSTQFFAGSPEYFGLHF
ncbi:hypothetical protein [Pandoraea apista]|uniref:Uncharacterized protein n=1 Tax=Pandoraea apista TaxID=93218 RepID=A0A5E5P8K8_9BURK|nr:hypothetical protein [Pandoraea apista]AJE99838.1 hypothetical protein SG18_19460 [Pandoraea apista]AKH73971.1 hypothetical protein XM39_19645 [Pandoraea apista]AKI62518.1 hypothetical protein AA956_12960 [Pandoraea apista]OXS96423.1 hypothetical protein B7H01_05005 [Pandoraea apista]RRW99605.1 hypothetical protein EGJ54_02200 [Pandoraea apista]